MTTLATLPTDLLIQTVDRMDGCDAAAFACACRDAVTAYRESAAYGSVRVAKSGAVLEPASGTFDVEVEPGESVCDAVQRCRSIRRGGCVLLRPGAHAVGTDWSLFMQCFNDVHIFGRGRAILSGTIVVTSCMASLVGVNIVDDVIVTGHIRPNEGVGFGRFRIQECELRALTCQMWSCSTVDRCVIRGGVLVSRSNARLVGNALENGRLTVNDGATAHVANNRFRFSLGTVFAVAVSGSSATIMDNVIESTGALYSSVGIDFRVGSHACVVERNVIINCEYGIQMADACEASIIHNELRFNLAGLVMFRGSRATFANNHVLAASGAVATNVEEKAHGVTLANPGTGGSFTANRIEGFDVGVFACDGADASVVDNSFSDCRIGLCINYAQGSFTQNQMHAVKAPLVNYKNRNMIQITGLVITACTLARLVVMFPKPIKYDAWTILGVLASYALMTI